MPEDARFCAQCGTRLELATASAEARKLVTVLFCDLVGSTTLGERLDPETFRQVQFRYFAACETALHRHGGTVEKFIGDAVLCVFGMPTAREDDAPRACRAALDLLAGIDKLNADLAVEWGVRLAVRIGVNTGPVVVGEFSHGQLAASGDAVNTAARLEQAAGPGEVLIGAPPRALVGDEGVCVPVPPLELKGKAGAVPAWRLVDMDARRAHDPSGPRELPLVGRDDELRMLELWIAERTRGSGLCAVLGAPGIGKSRLLVELARRTERRVLWGRCPPYGEGITYRLLADWVATQGDEAIVRAAGDQAAEQLRFATEQGEAPATTEEIQAAAQAWMSGLVSAGDVMLIAEDIHWAEPSMLELLVALARVPGVALVASARPEILELRPQLASHGDDMRLDLEPLTREQAEAFLNAAADGIDTPQRERILGDAEGNPLMLSQLALHVAEGGDLEELPPGLEAVLQARVERLSPEERWVAQRGAVMGREFWDSGVAALAPDSASPEPAIALLARRGVVAEGRADGAPSASRSPTLSRAFSDARPYSFTHALLRDRIYEATPKLRRADLHEQLGTLLEQSSASEEVIAFHLERAAQLRAELQPQDRPEVAGRAAEHLERAGQRALVLRDGDAARALLTRAAALLESGGEARERIERSLAEPGVAVRADLVPGDVIGGYRVRGIAGRGGMGVVYRAEDLALGREVALKVIAPDLAADSRFRQRFARESRIAAGLEHPNVVPVYSAGEESGQLFIAMRFVQGTDLQQVLREGALAPDRAAAIVAQIGDALDAAHARGLVHRDVKPANVLVSTVGGAQQAYLTDFGLTRDAAAGDGLTKTGQWVGTIAYVAPEQIRGEPVDARADIYALGAVLYQCLTGRPPFAVASELEALAAHLDEPPPRPSKDGAPRALDGVVHRAMSKDPARRFRSAGDLGRAALAAVDGTRARLSEQTVATGSAAPVDAGRRKQRRSRRFAVLVGAAAGVGLAALGLAVAVGTDALPRGGASTPKNPAGQIVGAPVALPHDPDFLDAGSGRVWALASSRSHLVRYDVATQQVDSFTAGVDLGGQGYGDLAVGPNAIWIARTSSDIGGVDHVDPATGEAQQHIPLPRAAAVDADRDSVWAVASGDADAPGVLARIDPVRDRLVGRTIPVGRDPADVAIDKGAIWVANRGDDSVWRIDPRTSAVKARIPVGDAPTKVALTDAGVWVANFGDGTLLRIDSATNRVLGAPVSLGKDIQDIQGSDDALWVAAGDGTVSRLNPRTGELVGSPLSTAGGPLALAVDGDSLWVGSSSDESLTHIKGGKP